MTTHEENYNEFKLSYEDDYKKFISSLLNLSGSRMNDIIDTALKSYFKTSLSQYNINCIKSYIIDDIKHLSIEVLR